MYRIPNKRILEDKEFLYSLYSGANKSSQEIADIVGCSKYSVLRALRRFNINIRKRTNKNKLLGDKEFIKKQYLENSLSLNQIAKLTNSTPGNIWTILRGLGIKTRNYKDGLKTRFPDGRIGALSSNWRGGVTDENYRARRTIEYKNWRKEVFKRDNYICVFCGKRGGDLEADHIKQFAFYPELRLKLSNGRTLCKPCHKNTLTHSNKIKPHIDTD